MLELPISRINALVEYMNGKVIDYRRGFGGTGMFLVCIVESTEPEYEYLYLIDLISMGLVGPPLTVNKGTVCLHEFTCGTISYGPDKNKVSEGGHILINEFDVEMEWGSNCQTLYSKEYEVYMKGLLNRLSLRDELRMIKRTVPNNDGIGVEDELSDIQGVINALGVKVRDSLDTYPYWLWDELILQGVK